MKIVQINATSGAGSTGKICESISEILTVNKTENYIFYSAGNSNRNNSIKYMTEIEIKQGALEARIRGNYGFNSSWATKRLIKKLNAIDPDVVHLHNIHGHNCNLDLLFSYLKEKQKNIIWTFHDCWAFTGSCTYFSFVKCDKWKTKCEKCPKAHEFSWFFDTSTKLYQKKKQLFEDCKLTVVTPSVWLSELVQLSFLKNYPVEVINNGIDTSIFKPTKSDFRKKYNIKDDEKIVLGVGFEWGLRKGLDVFIKLSGILPSSYRIVLVGTNDSIDKQLPDSIVSIHRTNNQKELAEIYSIADVFVNPTREDNYPTVNMEAIACGTPVVTFDNGGSPEMIDESCGIVVPPENMDELVDAIKRVVTGDDYTQEACLNKSLQFNQTKCFAKYLELYRKIELA